MSRIRSASATKLFATCIFDSFLIFFPGLAASNRNVFRSIVETDSQRCKFVINSIRLLDMGDKNPLCAESVPCVRTPLPRNFVPHRRVHPGVKPDAHIEFSASLSGLEDLNLPFSMWNRFKLAYLLTASTT